MVNAAHRVAGAADKTDNLILLKRSGDASFFCFLTISTKKYAITEDGVTIK